MTPEGVAFSLPIAGVFSRCLAWLLDIASLAVITNVIGLTINLMGVISLSLSNTLRILLFFAVNIGYAIVLEWFWNGQTLGKRVVGLRVMDVRGLRLRFSQVAIRNLLRAVDGLPLFYFLGGLTCLISRNGQRLGDLAANTVVVGSSWPAEPRIDLILDQNHYNSLRAYPHLAARLRQRIGPREAYLGLQALIRRDELDPEARVDLFQSMADHFRRSVVYPEIAVSGISDEQYVRDVVDLLYKK